MYRICLYGCQRGHSQNMNPVSLFKLIGSKDPSVVRSINLPKPVFPHNDDVSSVASFALLRVRNAPVQPFRSWHTATVKHPSIRQERSDIILAIDTHGISPVGIHTKRSLLGGFGCNRPLFELLAENHGTSSNSSCPTSRTLGQVGRLRIKAIYASRQW